MFSGTQTSGEFEIFPGERVSCQGRHSTLPSNSTEPRPGGGIRAVRLEVFIIHAPWYLAFALREGLANAMLFVERSGKVTLRQKLATGKFLRVLEDWCQAFPGFFLYFPSRSHSLFGFDFRIHARRAMCHVYSDLRGIGPRTKSVQRREKYVVSY